MVERLYQHLIQPTILPVSSQLYAPRIISSAESSQTRVIADAAWKAERIYRIARFLLSRYQDSIQALLLYVNVNKNHWIAVHVQTNQVTVYDSFVSNQHTLYSYIRETIFDKFTDSLIAQLQKLQQTESHRFPSHTYTGTISFVQSLQSQFKVPTFHLDDSFQQSDTSMICGLSCVLRTSYLLLGIPFDWSNAEIEAYVRHYAAYVHTCHCSSADSNICPDMCNAAIVHHDPDIDLSTIRIEGPNHSIVFDE
jgi:hypothetical protein